MTRLALTIFLIFTLAGCSVKYLPVVSRDTVRVVNEVVRDSIIELPADSSFIKAWFECDSLNQVIMTELQNRSGKKVKHSTSFNQGQLIVKAKVDSQAVYIAWKERHDSTAVLETVIKEVEVEKIVYRKPKWLKSLASIGVGSIFLLIFIFIKKIKK